MEKKKATPLLFAYEHAREEQLELIQTIHTALQKRTHVLAHAPTGLGKTAAAIAPALTYALKHNKKVFFLTSRYTQHKIALETLQLTQEKYQIPFSVSDMIGKKWMCLVGGVTNLSTTEFTSYCKKARELQKCDYYANTRKQNQLLTVDAKATKEYLKTRITTVKTFKEECDARKLCPYEMAIEIAKDAAVILGDYYYIFHPKIRQAFLKKTDIALDDAIVIVDEAHNLHERIKELSTARISTYILNAAKTEAATYGLHEAQEYITFIEDILKPWQQAQVIERTVSKEWFMNLLEEKEKYAIILDTLQDAVETVYTQQQRSFISSVHEFLVAWQGTNSGYVRILSKDKFKPEQISLSYRCLDPRVQTQAVLQEAHSVIFMSGTLQPIDFYNDILGLPDTTQKVTFSHPFPQENALHLVVPQTTTKYAERSEEQFAHIAKICSDVVNTVDGNCAIFFPSYDFLRKVEQKLAPLTTKKVIAEEPMLTKEQKTEMLESFRREKTKGAVLLGAATGNFGEGVDLPGDLLNCVVVVGLPLNRPDLETEALIKYYDSLFKKGWDYGYIYPAFNTTLQNAGRCIRSHTDKGVIVYLDKRYAWPQYHKCFPKDLNVQIAQTDYLAPINEFLKNRN